ncbi:MFS transporter [Roseateles sp. DB2]|uniref:MFS transporter n=1 Tax=Roseateles sp. DB2 TaxID=3453717 RepID=UPI003EEAC746
MKLATWLAGPAGEALPRQVLWLILTRSISALGAGMTMFAINVWIYEQSRSYALFAALTLLTSVPNLLLGPMVGVIVDRCNKKTLLTACEAFTAGIVLCALAIVMHGPMALWQAGLVILALSVAGSFRWTLMAATIGSLVPKEALGRANGLLQALAGVSEVSAPLLGAVALHALGPAAVFGVDAATSIVAVLAILGLDARLLQPREQRGDVYRFWRDAFFGLRWIGEHAHLRRILWFITGYNVAGGVFMVGFVPHLLTFANQQTLGMALALEGAGAFVGGMLFTRAAIDARKAERLVYATAAGFGAVMTAWGFVNGPAGALVVAAASGMLTSTLIASLQTLWHSLVPPELQGRVFATRRMVSYSLIPVATLASIPLASHVMTPALQAWPSLQLAWGAPEPGGLGLLNSVMGMLLVPACLLAAAWSERQHRARAREHLAAQQDGTQPELALARPAPAEGFSSR